MRIRGNHILFIIAIFLLSCNEDDSLKMDEDLECGDDFTILIEESDSIVLAEFENASFGEGWKLVRNTSNATGEGYMRWEGTNQFSNPGQGIAVFQIQINHPGIYRFIWRSAVTEGDNPTEANDTWLRFTDADDFFGMKGDGSLVYPGGTGKSPTPEGASKEGWFKVYRSGTPLDFKWQSRTSDNDAHNIYVNFKDPGIYKMEISGRSHGHAIDKFALFQEQAYNQNDVAESTNFSEISCM